MDSFPKIRFVVAARGVLKHPTCLLGVGRGREGVVTRYLQLEKESLEGVQARYLGTHPDGLVHTRDFAIYVHRRFHTVSAKIISSGEWEPTTSKLVRGLVRADSLVVDVGANIGWYSLMAAKRARSVWAFEPEPSNLTLLRRSIVRNHLTNIVVVPEAVMDFDGETNLWLSDVSAGQHSTVLAAGPEVLRVGCKRLDSLFPSDTIDLLKIDVEGAEPQVLAGAARLIQSGRIKNIVLEWNPRMWDGKSEILENFMAFHVDGRRVFRRDQAPLEQNILLRPR